MHNWLSIELVVTILLVTSFTWVGLLAVWAANSPRHWFVRFAVVLAVLSPLLFVPAHELFLTFLLPVGYAWGFALIVWAFKKWGKRRREKRGVDLPAQPRPTKLRFSVQSLLLVVAAIAMALAVVTRLSVQWPDVLQIGLQVGSALGAAAVIVAVPLESKLPWWARGIWGLGLLLQAFIWVTVTGVVASNSMQVVYPVAESTKLSEINPVFWIGSALAATLLVAGATFMGLAKSPIPTNPLEDWLKSASPPARPSRAARLSLTAILTVVVLPWVAFIWELLHPLPIPREQAPNPNGFDRLIAIHQRFANGPVFTEFGADPVDYVKLAKAVANQQADYAELGAAMELPVLIPTSYDPTGYVNSNNRISALRTLLNMLAAKNDVDVRANDLDAAVAVQKEMLHLAEIAHQSGVAVDSIYASVMDSITTEQVYSSIRRMNKPQCIALLDEVASVETRRRDIDGVLQREQVWMQRADGWVGHAGEIIARWAAKRPDQWNVYDSVATAHRRSQAFARLLTVELALRAYELDHGALPKTLDDLTPMYLAAVPTDPCDPSAKPLRYMPDGDSYILYSFGDDRDDDGGISVTTNNAQSDESTNDGDIRLDEHFKTESMSVPKPLPKANASVRQSALASCQSDRPFTPLSRPNPTDQPPWQ